MKLFAVFKTAIYRHECGGIFSTYGKALYSARKLIERERDSHHQYEIVPFEIDTITEQDDWGDIMENLRVALFYKDYDKPPIVTLVEGEKSRNSQRWI